MYGFFSLPHYFIPLWQGLIKVDLQAALDSTYLKTNGYGYNSY
jgi:hypothetical protein